MAICLLTRCTDLANSIASRKISGPEYRYSTAQYSSSLAPAGQNQTQSQNQKGDLSGQDVRHWNGYRVLHDDLEQEVSHSPVDAL